MIPATTPENIRNLHALFCALTKQDGLTLRYDRERMWHDWARAGFGETELREVVRYLQSAIAEGRRNPGALKLSNLIGQPDRFEEDLFEARRLAAPKPKKETIW